MISRLSFCLVVALIAPAAAQPFMLGDLSIHGPWSRALPAVAPNGAAYFEVENGGEEAVHIVSASSPIAERAEIHTHEMDGEVMKMRHVTSVRVPPGSTVPFEPGGLHVMLIGLKQPLVDGGSFPLTLELDGARAIEVTVEIVGAGATGRSGHGDHRHRQLQ